MTHPVGFQLHHLSEPGLGNLLEVGRVILAGKGIVTPPGRSNQTAEFARPDARCSLEHHVLEQMGNAGRAIAFVQTTGVIPDHMRHRRRTMILLDDHPQTIGQALFKGIGERGERDA